LKRESGKKMSEACHGFDKVKGSSDLKKRDNLIAQTTGSRNLDGSKVAKFLVG